MSHRQQRRFFKNLRKNLPEFFTGTRVVELGSLDINGSLREFFDSPIRYLGVDLDRGPGVDWTGFAHLFAERSGEWDAVVSAEMFEHDRYWDRSWLNMTRLARPGGLVAFSCATTGRAEHGTTASHPKDSSLSIKTWGDYYRNLTELDFRGVVPVEATFTEFEFSVDRRHKDLYFWGRKKGGATCKDCGKPWDASVQCRECGCWVVELANGSKMVSQRWPSCSSFLSYSPSWLYLP